MPDNTSKTIDMPLRGRNLIKLPEAVIEECNLSKGSPLSVTWGKNYSCVIVMPPHIKLGDNQKERIRILTTEPLDSNR